MALPLARLMLALGISTTGRVPLQGFALPLWELAAIIVISVAIALLGVVAPLRSLYRMQIAEVLQPRFMAQDVNRDSFRRLGLSWLLLLPLLIMSYIALRPFVQSWLSVVQFFLFESVFVLLVTAATLWWVRPFLKIVIAVFERLLQPVFPLETLLAGRRMRLTSEKIVFSITGVVLVFSLLTGLHGITRALKGEIISWADEAMSPYIYFIRQPGESPHQDLLATLPERHAMYFFRVSAKVEGSFPLRF
jgi:hypothetical protein